MSVAQRIVVRMGLEAAVPALHFGELGLDTDTMTVRVGNDTANPAKIMTTLSTGNFDYSNTDTVIFNNIEFAPGGGLQGVDLSSLTGGIGIVIGLAGGQFRHTTIGSSDNSVIITNGNGQSGTIDLKVSSASIAGALGAITNQINVLGDAIEDLQLHDNENDNIILALQQLTGRPALFTDLGTFLGNVIPDGSTIKTALQALETALQGLGAAAFNLEIVSHQIDQLSIELKDDDYITLHGATPDLAGLMTGNDKQKLNWLTITEAINIHDIQVTDFEATGTTVTLINSNMSEIAFPIADGSGNAGAISGIDKAKLDRISVGNEIDLDQLENRVTVLENFTVAPTLYKVGATVWTSTDTVTTYDIDLTSARAFAVTYQRPLNGYEFEPYDAITIGDVEVVQAENVTQSYEGALTILKARDNQWYYVDHRGLAILLADALATTLTIDVGSKNAVKVNNIIYV